MNIVDELHAIAGALHAAAMLDDRVEVALPAGPITFVSLATLRMKRAASRRYARSTSSRAICISTSSAGEPG